MKRAILWAVTVLVFSGCSTPQPTVSLTDGEKKSIKEGKLVTFQDIRPTKGSLRLDKATLPNGVYVCASGWKFPTPNCYPNLGKLVSQYLADRGIPIAKDQASADQTLYFNAAFWYEGHMPDPNFSYALEMWLVKGGALESAQRKGTGLETGVTFLVGRAMQIGGLAMFGAMMSSGGGYYADRHWVSVTMVAVDTKTATQVNNAPWGVKAEDMSQFEFAGRYIGPVKAVDSSLPLFEQAMNKTLDQVVRREKL
ncbi:MAG: hypothetical protein KKH12_10835 [Gammaproteobacteria bacterium]|nr:hypothetical protein [Gammaproteobacteria bacterium]MBU1482152.1 hypothetical protein [Gammaproteobacteria bacterium]